MADIVLENHSSFRWWYWCIVPLAAIVAYWPALSVGFLSDDYGFLFRAETRDLRGYLGWPIFLPTQGPGVAFYRPFGMLTTWQLGWQIWKLNPLPYHVLGLGLHACVSLVLGLWVRDMVSKPLAGIVAGVLFAVFPVHTEAVAWISSQWDIWAAFFAITSLWLFYKWWNAHAARQTWVLYWLSILCYTLAIFSKESALSWVGVLGLVPLFSLCGKADAKRRDILVRGLIALAPFVVVLALYLTVRLVALGSFGGYSAATSSPDIIFSNAIGDIGALLAPANPVITGDAFRWLSGAISCVVLVVGLAFFARHNLRSILFGVAMLVIAFVPVLSLQVNPADFQGNRFLYLPALGYCAVVAILVHGVLEQMGFARKSLSVGLAGVVVVGLSVLTWLHLGAWQQATVQADGIGSDLARLITPSAKTLDVPPVWYVQDIPDTYKGAQGLRNGIGNLYYFRSGAQPPALVPVTSAVGVQVADPDRDTFAIQFAYDEVSSRFHIPYAVGQTSYVEPTLVSSSKSIVWDFRGCGSVVSAWFAENAITSCSKDVGLTVRQNGSDPQIAIGELASPIRLKSGAYLRFGLAANYPEGVGESGGNEGRFYWQDGHELDRWPAEKSVAFDMVTDRSTHVYWALIDGTGNEQSIGRLRFDLPEGISAPIEIRWIAVEVVDMSSGEKSP